MPIRHSRQVADENFGEALGREHVQANSLRLRSLLPPRKAESWDAYVINTIRTLYGCGSKKGYVAVSRHPPMLHTYVAPTCFIRMSRGLSRLFHAVLKNRYETHAVPRRGLSQGLVAEACRGGLSRTACRELLVASRTALLQTLCRGKTPGSQLHV